MKRIALNATLPIMAQSFAMGYAEHYGSGLQIKPTTEDCRTGSSVMSEKTAFALIVDKDQLCEVLYALMQRHKLLQTVNLSLNEVRKSHLIKGNAEDATRVDAEMSLNFELAQRVRTIVEEVVQSFEEDSEDVPEL